MNIDLERHFEGKVEERQTIYFESFIQYSMRGLPRELLEKRNKAIIALFFHFLASIAGFSFYAIRKNRLYIVINTFSVILAVIGIVGVLKMMNYLTLVHGILTSAVFGSFFLYSLIEAAFGEAEAGEQLPEVYILMLLAIPYFVDFLVGLYTMTFATEVLDHLAQESKQRKEEQERLISSNYNMEEVNNSESNLCAICMERERNCVFYRCGHKAACYNCGKDIQQRVRLCPICRVEITDVVRVYS